MDLDDFWALVSESGGDATRLERIVRRLSAADLVTFTGIWDAQHTRACRCELREAAMLLNDAGMGDDSFKDFRSWLTGRGRVVFEAAVADPDSLAELPNIADIEDFTDEAYGGVALHAWFDLHDDEPDDAAYDELNAVRDAYLTVEEREFDDSSPGGKQLEWSEVPRLFPRIWALRGHRYDEAP